MVSATRQWSFLIFRYYAICKPMVAQGRCTISRAKKIIICLSIMALLMSIPMAYEKVWCCTKLKCQYILTVHVSGAK